ncbi:CPBP family intramembrane glutamic endopeptidase [Pseudoalteromonas aurantia]|nr:type II CAAX endopeptidase family protein [Pseudoalteromonas aurantia]
MNKLKKYMHIYPAMVTIIMTCLFVGALFVVKVFEPTPAPLFNWPRLILITVSSAAILSMLKQFGWTKSVGVTSPYSSWHPKWLLCTTPLLLIALLSMTSANWAEVQLSTQVLIAWLFSNFATGFFEEVLMRGMCFYILLKAWGATKKGVLLAAVFQAIVFGLAHLGNLYHMPMIDVGAQVIFATLIGIGFAGLVYFTQSLWPAIIVHTIINCAGTINNYLVPNTNEFQSPSFTGYIVIIVIFLLLSTLPGLLYIKASQLHVTEQNDY